MLRHVILWQMKDELTAEERDRSKKAIKEALEELAGVIPGLLEIHVITEPLPSSNTDFFLDSLFKDEAALKVYADHPAHVKVKDELVVPNVKSRMCMDYTVESCSERIS